MKCEQCKYEKTARQAGWEYTGYDYIISNSCKVPLSQLPVPLFYHPDYGFHLLQSWEVLCNEFDLL